MSEPIQYKPGDFSSTPDPHPTKKDGQSTKVAEVALGVLRSPLQLSLPLDPKKVELAVKKPFQWHWNSIKQGDNLKWVTEVASYIIEGANKEQFPILQPSSIKKIKGLFDYDTGSIEGFIENRTRFLNEIGFSLYSGEFMTPTREQLVINYNRYQGKNPHFPKLVFKMADGVLEPEEFVSSVLESDLILSKGQEWIHDCTYHTIPTLIGIFQAPEYYRPYKDSLRKTVSTVLEFLKNQPSEIQKRLNAQLTTPIEESDIIDIIATLKYMVGAALDVLTGQMFDYKKIIEKGDQKGGVNHKFFTYLLGALYDKRWRSNLESSVRFSKSNFLEPFSDNRRWIEIVHAIFTETGLGNQSIE